MSGDPTGRRLAPGWLLVLLRRLVVGLLVLGVGGFLIDGANRPANPYLAPARVAAPQGLAGFPAASLSVSSTSGTKTACVLEARTEAQRDRGLMGQRSLGGYAGMAFVFSPPADRAFWMRGTVLTLQIAWFGTGGRYIASAVMVPCPPARAACPTYSPGRPFEVALEVPAGRLTSLGVGPGSAAHLGGPCSI